MYYHEWNIDSFLYFFTRRRKAMQIYKKVFIRCFFLKSFKEVLGKIP